MNEATLRAALARLPVSSLHYFESIGSTNDYARSLAEQGAPDGALVVADEQTQGRGRLNRSWVTAPGAGLAFSLVLRPAPGEINRMGLFAPLCGLAVCGALRTRFNLTAEIKWPNDVLVNRRKISGILVEAAWLESSPQYLIAGIGVNVAPSSVPPANDLLFPATCVENELGHPIGREELLAAILEAFFDERARLGSAAFFEAWQSWLAFKGERVRVEGPSSSHFGHVVGISRDGSLRLLAENGAEIEVAVGDVSLRSE